MIFIDQTGRSIELSEKPNKIVSLVPSQTELLYDLGLNNEIVGITKFCIHPDEIFRTKTRVGGTKALKVEKIKSLNPDLIIANKEENTREQLEELMQLFPVWISDIKTLKDAMNMIKTIGEMTQTTSVSHQVVNVINQKFSELENYIRRGRRTAAYLIWQNPYMVAGGDTFIDEMMTRGGLINIFKNKNRYPVTNPEELKSLTPHFIMLSSEPFPFNEKHKYEFEKCFPESKILLVDGEMFSWYGSRLVRAADYLKTFAQQYLG